LSELYKNSFQALESLYGNKTLSQLPDLHVAVLGIGGVGSWTAESLARSGVGQITLIDLDDICVSNINRQIHALPSTAGQFKVDVMKKRILEINPECQVNCFQEFFTKKNAQKIMDLNADYYVDCFDAFEEKVELIKICLEQKKKLVCAGSVGGKVDPSKIRLQDLSQSSNDRLLFRVRKILRTQHKIPTDQFMGIQTIYSTEQVRYLSPEGEICKLSENPRVNAPQNLNCFAGLGSCSFVTASFGFFAASAVINDFLDQRP
jgi:tRNA A37 threonylcarbamoyladenosine dehydratase